MPKQPCVYILANRKRGTLYIGVTSNLAARIYQHRKMTPGTFVAKYNVTRLVHVEFTESMIDAITREKQLKNWKRKWKIELIEQDNPDWIDLFDRINW